MTGYNYIVQTGVIVPDTSNILAEVEAEYREIFGADLVTTPDTPQGLLIATETIARTKIIQNNADSGNMLNPNLAKGLFLDAIMGLFQIQRKQATPSIISGVVITGVVGTVVPINTQARTLNGDIFYLQSAVTIGGGGSITGTFISQENGVIPCSVNTLTTFVTPIIGVETINNPSAGVLGKALQTDIEARAYRNNTLAFQGSSSVGAIKSALFTIPSMIDCQVYENSKNVSAFVNGLLLGRQSIYVICYGGDNLSIASAIVENKAPGCDMNGTQSVSIISPVNGQLLDVKFDYVTNANIIVEVTITNGNQDDIKNSVLDYFSELKIADSISPFEIAYVINRNNPEYYVKNVRIALLGGSLSNNTIDLIGNQIGYSQLSYITVVIA